MGFYRVALYRGRRLREEVDYAGDFFGCSAVNCIERMENASGDEPGFSIVKRWRLGCSG